MAFDYGNFLNGLSEMLSNPNSGTGVGTLPIEGLEAIKAVQGVHNATNKFADQFSKAQAAAPSPLNPSAADPTIATTQPQGLWDKIKAGTADMFSSPEKIAGFQALTGGLAKAISAPGSWQAGVGAIGQQMGQNTIADIRRKESEKKLGSALANGPLQGASSFLQAPTQLGR